MNYFYFYIAFLMKTSNKYLGVTNEYQEVLLDQRCRHRDSISETSLQFQCN